MQRIGLFGGSFDPVHLGHLLVAQAAREELDLARLFFIPAAQSPFKPDSQPTPAPERLRLLRLALAGKTWCEIDEQEIQRGGVSYTIDTVRDYAGRFPGGAALLLDWRGSPAPVAKVARGGGAGAAGRVCGHSPARAGGDAVSRAFSRALAGRLSAGRFLVADSRAGKGRLAHRAPGARRGGRSDPQ